MIPGSALSSVVVAAAFTEQVNRRTEPLIDYEMGGVAVGDASQGLLVRLWRVRVVGDDVVLDAEGVEPQTLFSRPGLTEVALAFDQTMRPHIAFVQHGMSWLWWFDTTVGDMTFTSFPGMVSPRLTTDEKRPLQIANSDVILAYVQDGGLYFRMQRERFQTAHLLKADVGGTLVSVGMNTGNRLQFRLTPNTT